MIRILLAVVLTTGCVHRTPVCPPKSEACELAQRVLDEPQRRAEADAARQQGVDEAVHGSRQKQ